MELLTGGRIFFIFLDFIYIVLKIEYEAKSFPRLGYGIELRGSNTLEVDWREIVWAAITVGKRNKSHVAVHGMYSCCEIINRSSLIWMSLKSEGDRLKKTDVYLTMDPTEKVFVSFSLGMTMAKMFSAKLLNTPWLEHVAKVNNSISTTSKTRSRPDLIGLNSNKEFVIVEAKGRTNKVDKPAHEKAKLQTKVISNIDGKAPCLRVAFQSFFNDDLEVILEDPDEVEEEQILISVDRNYYLQSYYEIFAALSKKDIGLLKRAGVELNFDESLKKAFKTNIYKNIDIESTHNYEDEDGYMCFVDGIKLRLTGDYWSDRSLSLNPYVR